MAVPNELILHAFEGSDLRITDRDGNPWFVATDAAKVLGYRDAEHLTRTLDADEKDTHTAGTLGGPQKVAIISEPGLMRAISQRRVTAELDPEIAARIVRFQRWLYHDVLPSIRRTGSYGPDAASTPTKAITARELQSAFKAWHGMAKTIGLEGNMALIAANQATVKTTGVSPLDVLGQTHLVAEVQEPLMIPTEIGLKLGGLNAKQVNQRLLAHGFQIHDGPGWAPTERGKPIGKWMDTGKRQGQGTPVLQWKWYATIIDHIRGEPQLALVDADHDGGAA